MQDVLAGNRLRPVPSGERVIKNLLIHGRNLGMEDYHSGQTWSALTVLNGHAEVAPEVCESPTNPEGFGAGMSPAVHNIIRAGSLSATQVPREAGKFAGHHSAGHLTGRSNTWTDDVVSLPTEASLGTGAKGIITFTGQNAYALYSSPQLTDSDNSRSSRSNKRGRCPDDGESDSDEGEMYKRPDKRAFRNSPSECDANKMISHLACPYVKHSPAKHGRKKSCMGPKMSGWPCISRLK